MGDYSFIKVPVPPLVQMALINPIHNVMPAHFLVSNVTVSILATSV